MISRQMLGVYSTFFRRRIARSICRATRLGFGHQRRIRVHASLGHPRGHKTRLDCQHRDASGMQSVSQPLQIRRQSGFRRSVQIIALSAPIAGDRRNRGDVSPLAFDKICRRNFQQVPPATKNSRQTIFAAPQSSAALAAAPANNRGRPPRRRSLRENVRRSESKTRDSRQNSPRQIVPRPTGT